MSTKSNLPHLTEEILEQYSIGTLSETEIERVEEHLFVCHSCQDLHTQTDDYVATMKAATHELSLQPVAEPVAWWRKLFAIPKPLMAAAACALLAVVFFIPRNEQMATVELQTLRGPEAPAVAPAGASLNLRLSLRGLDTLNPLRIEVADASGNIVMKTDAQRADGLAVAKVDSLASGVYWVRLYSGDELLREYGLNAR
jgi:anti-sigma factor RsiW